ncbi:hypothetical protein TGDOM2_357050 [Toxoplasma gondii GAB2-2007-GAL-DOM2]|uniref:Uncharacterized protein n=2 Tax=Toxoplasma gondii TaxID=5811 RepID=V4Z8X9_TOXGV|nr:hypothetical protein TGVEG_357050 [Toxoplasma gondii VEG]KFG35390.1 hypothetical protein TGDOM2_357050 [Toxoplasma gondii GAB2-2007-GAL-DOM2]
MMRYITSLQTFRTIQKKRHCDYQFAHLLCLFLNTASHELHGPRIQSDLSTTENDAVYVARVTVRPHGCRSLWAVNALLHGATKNDSARSRSQVTSASAIKQYLCLVTVQRPSQHGLHGDDSQKNGHSVF